MTDQKNKKFGIEDAIAAMRDHQPDAATIEAARDRVWMNLRGTAPMPEMASIHGCADVEALLPAYRTKELAPARQLIVEDHLRECVECRSAYHGGGKVVPMKWKRDESADSAGWDVRRMAFAAVALVVIGVSSFFSYQLFLAPLPGNRAVVQAASGQLYLVNAHGDVQLQPGRELQEGDVVRTAAGSRAVLRMFDGSVVEMNERAEFSIEARRNATTINLHRGNIIVQAAKQRGGNLFVVAPDCKVAVTGTVFAVNTGMKGSRVSVVEGEVHVAYSGEEEVLRSGDQVVTADTLGTTAVESEFDWSANREQHLALLAEFSKLQRKLESIPGPALRYESGVLPLTPANTVVYASIPNLGDQLNEAHRIFQDQLRDSPVLQDWWTKSGMAAQQPRFEEMISKVHTFSRFLGDEVVFTVQSRGGDSGVGALAVARVTKPGLRDYLQAELDNAPISAEEKGKIRIVDETNYATTTGAKGDLLIFANENLVVIASDATSLNSLLNARHTSSGFSGSSFGQAIAASYQEGAGLVFAADLQAVLLREATDGNDPRKAAQLTTSGFGDVRHFVAKRRETAPGQFDNRAALTFAQQRRGIASWLAAPTPIGALEFVSQDATIVGAAAVKSPERMVDDLMAMMLAAGKSPEQEMAKFREKASFDLRNDLAASIGSDFAFALDGPVLPTPSWKFAVEVNDAQKLQNTLHLIVNRINQEATAAGRPGLTLTREEVDDRVFYSVAHAGGPQLMTVHYTYAYGYLVAAPSRAMVLRALQVRDGGSTFSRSAKFLGLLPKDPHTNVSGLLYQDLQSVAGPLAQNLPAAEAQSLQVIAANARPSVLVVYGDEDRIELATASRFFGFDVNTAALSQLLQQTVGTLAKQNP